jgi:hypothetical protein
MMTRLALQILFSGAVLTAISVTSVSPVHAASGSVIAIFDKEPGEILTGCAPQKRSAATRSRIDGGRTWAQAEFLDL